MAMASSSFSSSGVPTLPPPRPKSPPEYPDLYGKRRELAKVQMLEREISFLEGEIKFVENLPPASRCCKEYVIGLAIVLYCIACSYKASSCGEVRRFVGLADSGNGCVEHHVLTSHGCAAVLGSPHVSKRHAAAANAIYEAAIRVFLVVRCQNAGFVALGHTHDAARRSRAAATSVVAFHDVLRARIAIVDGVALGLNAQR